MARKNITNQFGFLLLYLFYFCILYPELGFVDVVHIIDPTINANQQCHDFNSYDTQTNELKGYMK